MNKQELIKHFEEMEYVSIVQMGKKSFIDMIKQLDEPQKPVVPQFVADWIEKAGKELSLRDLMSNSYTSFEVNGWLGEIDEDGAFKNQETFAKAVIYGYTVEKEKRYLVKMEGIKESDAYLNRDYENKKWYFDNRIDGNIVRTHHTRKELEEAGFGEVFNSPLFEVEEVE